MIYFCKVITDVDKNMVETIEDKYIVCSTQEEMDSIEAELAGELPYVDEYVTTDGMVICGLQIMCCYEKIEDDVYKTLNRF